MQSITITIEIHRTRDTQPNAGEVRTMVEMDERQIITPPVFLDGRDTFEAATHRAIMAAWGELRLAGVR